jgi:hypothetical protein
MGIWCTTLGASSTVVAAVYDDDDGGYPGTRLADVNSGAAWDTNTTGFKSTSSLSISLSAGFYWIATLSLTATPALSSSNQWAAGVPIVTTPVSNNPHFFRDATGSRTSLPTDVSAYTFEVTTSIPVVYLKAS